MDAQADVKTGNQVYALKVDKKRTTIYQLRWHPKKVHVIPPVCNFIVNAHTTGTKNFSLLRKKL